MLALALCCFVVVVKMIVASASLRKPFDCLAMADADKLQVVRLNHLASSITAMMHSNVIRRSTRVHVRNFGDLA